MIVTKSTRARSRCECGKVMSKHSNQCKACFYAAVDARYAKAQAIVDSHRCPDCGQGLRRNLALTGWWQCNGFGADGFRVLDSKPCSFQTFTRH